MEKILRFTHKKIVCLFLGVIILLCSVCLSACGNDPNIWGKYFEYNGVIDVDVTKSATNNKSDYDWIKEFITQDTLNWDMITCNDTQVVVSNEVRETLTSVDAFVTYFENIAKSKFATVFTNDNAIVQCNEDKSVLFMEHRYNTSGDFQSNYQLLNNNSAWVGTMYGYNDNGIYLTFSPGEATEAETDRALFNSGVCVFSFTTKMVNYMSDTICLTFQAKFVDRGAIQA